MDENILLLEKERSLHISRVPKNTKDAFVQLAEDEFSGDYGMTLKSLFDNFRLWKLLFENLDYKLDHIIEKISQSEQKEEPEQKKEKIRLLSGKQIEVKGGKKK